MSFPLVVLVASLSAAPVEDVSRPFSGPPTTFQVASLSLAGVGMVAMLTGVWTAHFSSREGRLEQPWFDVGQGLLLGGSLGTLTGVGLYLLGERLRLDALKHVSVAPTAGGAQLGVRFTF